MRAPPDPRPESEFPRAGKEGTFERLVPELLRRVIETGTKNISPDTMQKLLGELKLPKEALHYTISQLDETKNGVYRVIAKELHDLFERTNLSEEIAKALSSLSLEVKMEVRFKPTRIEAKTRRTTPPDRGDDAPVSADNPNPDD